MKKEEIKDRQDNKILFDQSKKIMSFMKIIQTKKRKPAFFFLL